MWRRRLRHEDSRWKREPFLFFWGMISLFKPVSQIYASKTRVRLRFDSYDIRWIKFEWWHVEWHSSPLKCNYLFIQKKKKMMGRNSIYNQMKERGFYVKWVLKWIIIIIIGGCIVHDTWWSQGGYRRRPTQDRFTDGFDRSLLTRWAVFFFVWSLHRTR